MKDCHNIKKNIFAVIDGTLPESDLVKYRNHLAKCPNCVQEEHAAREFRNTLNESGQKPHGDEIFWKKVWESPLYQEVIYCVTKPEEKPETEGFTETSQPNENALVEELVTGIDPNFNGKKAIQFDKMIEELKKLYKWPPGWKQISRDMPLQKFVLNAIALTNNLKDEGVFSSAYLKASTIESLKVLKSEWEKNQEQFRRDSEVTRLEWDSALQTKRDGKKK